jgi:glycosidase
MPVNPNRFTINVEDQSNKASSILYYFQEMVKIRKQSEVLSIGHYQPIENSNEQLFAFWRMLGQEKILVLLNFSEEVTNFPIPEGAKRLIGNYEIEKLSELRAWEAVVYAIS